MMTTNFQQFLKEELRLRQRKNAHYSLRSFARQIGVSPSYLSMVINGQKEASVRLIGSAVEKLGIAPALGKQWLEILEETKSKFFLTGKVAFYKTMSSEKFGPIREWYHYAILELTSIKNFVPSEKWVARILRISEKTVKDAVQHLVNAGYLRIENGTWTNISGSNSNIIPLAEDEDRKHLQMEILEQAKKALDITPIEDRDQTSVTVAIHTSRLAEAREKIKQFRRELATFLHQGGSGDEVYQLSISLFPLSNTKASDEE